MNTRNHPGIYIPPPMIYAACFLLSVYLQQQFPMNTASFHTVMGRIAGIVFLFLYLVLFIPAVTKFIKTKNTIVTIKPANSLQTTGIYRFTRNPMYLSLVMLYCGLAFLIGNPWTFLLLPLLILIVQLYIIKREEEYLHRAFGAQYDGYRKEVRRWV